MNVANWDIVLCTLHQPGLTGINGRLQPGTSGFGGTRTARYVVSTCILSALRTIVAGQIFWTKRVCLSIVGSGVRGTGPPWVIMTLDDPKFRDIVQYVEVKDSRRNWG